MQHLQYQRLKETEMKIEKLPSYKEKAKEAEVFQCCAVTTDIHSKKMAAWRRKMYTDARPERDPMLCQRNATVKIDDHNFCKIHAGQFLLNIELGKIE